MSWRSGARFPTRVLCASCLLAGSFLPGVAGGAGALTPEAAAAVQRLFPAGSIVGLGHEREGGVLFYEVVVRDGGETVEIEVTPSGAVGEIETEVALADLPPSVREKIVAVTGGRIGEIERCEVRGVPRNGTFAPIRPRVFYEVSYEVDGAWREFAVRAEGGPAFEHEEEGEYGDKDGLHGDKDDLLADKDRLDPST